MNSLAPEILHVITSLLQDDQQTLAQINLVSRAFYYVSLPYLYRAPTLLSLRQLESFTRILTSKHFPLIKTINLQLIPHRWQQNVSPTLENLLSQVHELEHLDLGYCNVDSRRIVDSISRCASLRYFSLNGVRNVTDNVIMDFVEDHPQLVGLDISCSAITDDSIYAISKHCQVLEELDISGCDQISEDGIRFLAQECKRLRYINIKDCYNVVPTEGEFDELPTNVDDGWETDQGDEE